MSGPGRWRAVTWALTGLLLALAWRAGARFPWDKLWFTLVRADVALLAGATIVNLIGMGPQALAWHLLLRPVARHQWWIAQQASLVGAAVNSLSVGVIGEAARIRFLTTRDPVPVTHALASVIWVRTIEGMGLALLVVAGASLFRLPAFARGAVIGAGVALFGIVAMLWFRGWSRLPAWMPRAVRRVAEAFGQIGAWQRLPAPLALALGYWLAQWATYHLTLVAVGIAASPAASLTATLAANIGGALRLTPANLGITQAAIAVALLPFGVPVAQAVAASLILQALQVLPVLALALAVVGWRRLGQLRSSPALGT